MLKNMPIKMNVPESHLLYKVVDGRKRLCVSYSQIETFLTCPMKWYKTYIEGDRSFEKQEATSYGSVIHSVLEYFFKNEKKPSAKDLGDAYNYYAFHEEIPFSSVESGLRATKQAVELISWMGELFEKKNGIYVKPDSELNPAEKLLRRGVMVGIEERFDLPYRLPEPVDINGEVHTHVIITGSIDLHPVIKTKDGIHHYVVDWKSGNHLFDNKKLETNLQHPIYSFYILRKYGGALPDMCIYFFTRTREYQKVKVDKDRVNKSIEILNDAFKRMYNFGNRNVSKFYSYSEIEKKDGSKGYVYRTEKLRENLDDNMKPCPSALCYYCDFGKHKKGTCPFSSDWDPSKKKKQ